MYKAATRIKERKPWEKFWDMDLIAIQRGKEEEDNKEIEQLEREIAEQLKILGVEM